MELSRVMFANSVKVGSKEMLFFLSSEYLISKDGPEISLTDRMSGARSCSSIYNAKYWVESEEAKASKPVKVK